MKIRYYVDPDDYAWNIEVEKLIPYIDGIGIDIGCGDRSINKDIIRLDIDPKMEPDIVASGDDIPVKDAKFDFLVSIHSFEHFEDQDKTLKEWLRVIKPGGYILLVHPDVTYTKEQKNAEANKKLRNNPHFKHFHERTIEQFREYIEYKAKYGYKVIEIGKAVIEWSFYCILRKDKK